MFISCMGCRHVGFGLPLKDNLISDNALESVTLKIFGGTFTERFFSGIQTDMVAKEIERATGVVIDVEAGPDNEKVQALLASGDLPDILITSNGNQLVKTLIKGDLIIPLDDLIKTNGHDIQNTSGKMLEFSRKYVSCATNELYFLLGNQSQNIHKAYWEMGPYVRWDFYKDVGYPPVRNGDDWLNMVAQMLKRHPVNQQGESVFGFSPWFDSLWYTSSIGMVLKGIEGEGTTAGVAVDMDMITEKYVPGILSDDSTLLAGIRFLNKAYRMELVDPQAPVQKYENAMEKRDSLRVLSDITASALTGANRELNRLGERDAEYLPLPMDTDAFNIGTIGPMGMIERAYCISRNCKYPEKAMDLLNYLFSYEGSRLLFSGIRGVDYEERNGNLFFIQKTKKDVDGNSVESDLSTGVGKYANIAGLGPDVVDPHYGQTLNLRFTAIPSKKEMTLAMREYSSYFNASYPAEVMYKRLKYMYIDSTLSALEPPLTTYLSHINSDIEEYTREALIGLMISENESSFDTRLEKIRIDLVAMGIRKLTYYKQEARNYALYKRDELYSKRE